MHEWGEHCMESVQPTVHGVQVVVEVLAEELEFLPRHGLELLLIAHEALVMLPLDWAECVAMVGLELLEGIEEVFHERVNLNMGRTTN
jgi:hypothetical protein